MKFEYSSQTAFVQLENNVCSHIFSLDSWSNNSLVFEKKCRTQFPTVARGIVSFSFSTIFASAAML